jgi:hypothetical protein
MAIEEWKPTGERRSLVWRYADPLDDALELFDCGWPEMTQRIRHWGSEYPPNQFEVIEFGIQSRSAGFVFGRRADWPTPSSSRPTLTYVVVILALDRGFQHETDPVSGRRIVDEVLDFMRDFVRSKNEGLPAREKLTGIALQVDQWNTRAKAVYDRNEFVEVWADGELIRMWRQL